MANSLGQLVVSLGLDAADFTSGLTKSELQARKFADALDRGVATAIKGTALAVTALVAATGVAAAAFQSLVQGAAQFKDLEESTGATAESLASLAVSGATAGVSMDSIGAAANKLTRTLVGVNDESKAAGAALGAIGISVKDFKNLDPVAQYEAVGKALGNFADGAGKVAIAQALFGKNGAEQLRVFKALEEAGGRQVILTQAQIELADSYADGQAKAKAQLLLYAQAASTELLPVLIDVTTAVKDFVKELAGLDGQVNTLTGNSKLKDWLQDVQELFGGKKSANTLTTEIDDLKRNISQLEGLQGKGFTVFGFFGSEQEREKQLDTLRRQLATAGSMLITRTRALTGERFNSFTDPRSTLFGQKPDQRPDLKFNFDAEGAGKAAAEQRKLLDGQLRTIRDFAKDQQDAFDFANTLVKGEYEDGLSTLRQFYESQATIRDAGLQAQLAAIDKEVAALRSYKPSDAADRVDKENKIADAVRKRSEIIAKSTRDNVLSTLEEQRATASLARSYVDLIAQVRDLSGDKRGAASLRIARQVADAQKLISQQGGDPGLAGELERQLSGAADLSDEQERYNRLVERARNEEESLLLAAQAGGKSELETLRSVGAARSETLKQLSEMVDRANELALALGTPDAIHFAEQLSLALKRATAEVDPLLGKIRDLGAEASRTIAEGFADAIVDGKGYVGVLKDIEKQLVRMAVNELFTKPAQQKLTNLIGGNGQASGGGGILGSIIGAVGNYFGGSGFSAFDTSGYGITSAGASLGSFGLGGGRAIGGPTLPNTVYPIAERKPEVYSDGSRSWLITGSQRGRVDPNPSTGGGRALSVTNHFTVGPNTDRRTQSQIAALAARSVAAASARNN